METRRQVLRTGLAALPLLKPSRIIGANNRIRIGIIGTGGRGNLLMDQLPAPGEVVALSDCDLSRCQDAVSKRSQKWEVYQDYRHLLDRKDIDGVVVSTNDHGRVLVSIRACQAGKDVYAEKPLSLYIKEGRSLVKAARKHKRIVQVGSQQRSMETNMIASDFVRSGKLGTLSVVQGVNYPGPERWTSQMPTDPPSSLDWNMWLGQSSMRPFEASLRNSWMKWYDFSGGQVTNWGCHGLDQIQSALGTSDTGPVEFWPLDDGPPGSIGFRYANGVTVRLELSDPDMMSGAIFKGANGSVTILRNQFSTNPDGLIKTMPRAEEIEKWSNKYARWQAKWHMEKWLECMRSRELPNADVEIGHRSVSLAHLVGITRLVNRKVVWDPETETFPKDSEANAYTRRTRRKGYEIPKEFEA